MDSSRSSSDNYHPTMEKVLFGQSQGQWLACLGPCMLTFGFPFLIPGVSLTCVGFIENANVPTFGGIHTLGLVCLIIAVVLIISGIITYCLFRPKVTPIPPGFIDSCVDLKARQRAIYTGSTRTDYFGSSNLSGTLSISGSKKEKSGGHVYTQSPVDSGYLRCDPRLTTADDDSLLRVNIPGKSPFYITSKYGSEHKHVDTPPEPVTLHSKTNHNYNLQNVNIKEPSTSSVTQTNNKSTHLESMMKSLKSNKISDSALYQLDAGEKGQHVAHPQTFNKHVSPNIESFYASSMLKEHPKLTSQKLDSPDQSMNDPHHSEHYDTDGKSKPRQTSSPRQPASVPIPPATPLDWVMPPAASDMTTSADDGYDDDILSDDTGESLTENSSEDSYTEKRVREEKPDTRGNVTGVRHNMSGLSLL